MDSGELHYQTWLKTLTVLSIPLNCDTFRLTFGMNNTRILTILLGKSPEADFLEMVSNRKESLFRRLIHGHLQLQPGALEFLSR